MASITGFTVEEMKVDEGLGYPKAYAKLCRDRQINPFNHGPPFTFIPYSLHQQDVLRGRDLDQMFPILDPKAKPATKPKIFVSLLWKQLNHLGNAGFDPEIFRVDPYGNVLYYHADSASPLAWEIDHWFPCSRGGLTVPSNLRILQWQVCKKKHNKLEYLVPWWEFQLGISINQFLSIFASSNSDFRRRAFSWLFTEGENEELNASQTVDSHAFPHHFIESKGKVGLAPAAIVIARRDPHDDASSVLGSRDLNRQMRPDSPLIAARKLRPSISKENENLDLVTNPYQAIVLARDSLKQREETAKMQAEIQKLDDEMSEIKQKNEEDKVAIQDLELTLIKRKRRAEKCRKLAEAQSSYRSMLEKMIRDAMHQSVIYKEQVRLNQAATNALMARLEAQKAICDSSEKELHRRFKQRGEIEKQIRPDLELARKRSRMEDTLVIEKEERSVLYLPGTKPRLGPLHKELRVFLEEEQKLSQAGLSPTDERKLEELDLEKKESAEKSKENLVENGLQNLEIGEGEKLSFQFPEFRESEIEEDEESRKQRGKGNVEKWLKMLLDDTLPALTTEDANEKEDTSKTDDIIRKLNLKYPGKEIKFLKFPESDGENVKQLDEAPREKNAGKGKEVVDIEPNILLGNKKRCSTPLRKGNAQDIEGSASKGIRGSESIDRKERRAKKGLVRSESARAFRRIPSSPMILNMRKGVDCIRKKPMVTGDDDDCSEENGVRSNFIKSSINTIKKVAKV
ncbi:hypothetical protein RJ641_020065 [Dillenia turbinata]|uniref:HNH nuclease domain-containing protein n=1 Tax=Dillenia turbinata TaxID=194707 RepID=A0AAN8UDT6_9MAGN